MFIWALRIFWLTRAVSGVDLDENSSCRLDGVESKGGGGGSSSLAGEGGREGGPGRTEIHHPGPYVYTTSQHNSLNKTISTISSRD